MEEPSRVFVMRGSLNLNLNRNSWLSPSQHPPHHTYTILHSPGINGWLYPSHLDRKHPSWLSFNSGQTKNFRSLTHQDILNHGLEDSTGYILGILRLVRLPHKQLELCWKSWIWIIPLNLFTFHTWPVSLWIYLIMMGLNSSITEQCGQVR